MPIRNEILRAAVCIVLTGLTLPAAAVDESLSPANVAKLRAKNIALTKKAVLDRLSDPDSAKFRNMTSTASGTAICGEVNAKNRMGGYNGYKRFYWIPPSYPGESTIDLRMEDDEFFAQANYARCK